eukprot:1364943-Amorphochlora_amoeboformis.AAC.2
MPRHPSPAIAAIAAISCLVGGIIFYRTPAQIAAPARVSVGRGLGVTPAAVKLSERQVARRTTRTSAMPGGIDPEVAARALFASTLGFAGFAGFKVSLIDMG